MRITQFMTPNCSSNSHLKTCTEATIGMAQAITSAIDRTSRIFLPSRFSRIPMRLPSTMIRATLAKVKAKLRTTTVQKSASPISSV